MPQVPYLTAPSVAPQAPPSPQASPEAFGAGVGRALQGLGSALNDTMSAMLDIAGTRNALRQGPEDDIAVQTHQWYLSQDVTKDLLDNRNSATIGDQNYLQASQQRWRQLNDDVIDRMQKEGFRPSERALQRMQLNSLQIMESSTATAISYEDQARRGKIVRTSEDNIAQMRASAQQTGDFEGLNLQTEEALRTLSGVLPSEDFLARQAAMRIENGNSVIAFLNGLQDKIPAGGINDDELEQVLARGKIMLKRAADLHWLDPAKAEEASQQWDENFRLRSFKALTPQEQNERWGGMAASGSAGISTELIYRFENREPWTSTHWDRNHWRIGYSSDTITNPDGTWREVQKGDVITKEDADRDLARRIKEAETSMSRSLGPSWDALSSNVKAALTSVFYNYGRLPSNVAAAVRTGDTEQIAFQVERLVANKSRRQQEAAVIRGQVQIAPALTGPYASLPGDVQQQLFEQTKANLNQEESDRQAAVTKAQAANYDAMAYRIEQMKVGGVPITPAEIQAGLESNLYDQGQAKTLLGSLNEVLGNTAASARAMDRFANDEPFNKLLASDVNDIDRVYETLARDVTPEERNVLGEMIAVSSGVVPTQIMAGIRAGLISADPGAMGQAITQAVRLHGANAQMFDGITNGDDVNKALVSYNSLIEQGISSQAAIAEMAKRNTEEWKSLEAKVEPATKVALQAFHDSDAKALTNYFDKTWAWRDEPVFANEATRQTMIAQYERLFKSHMIETKGDVAMSESLALYDLAGPGHGIWGVSEAGAQRVIMMFPPENQPKFYPPIGGSHDYFHNAVELFAREQATGTFDGNVTIDIIPNTDQHSGTAYDISAGRAPGYAVSWRERDADGQIRYHVATEPFIMTPEEIAATDEALAEQATRERAERWVEEETEMQTPPERPVLGPDEREPFNEYLERNKIGPESFTQEDVDKFRSEFYPGPDRGDPNSMDYEPPKEQYGYFPNGDFGPGGPLMHPPEYYQKFDKLTPAEAEIETRKLEKELDTLDDILAGPGIYAPYSGFGVPQTRREAYQAAKKAFLERADKLVERGANPERIARIKRMLAETD